MTAVRLDATSPSLSLPSRLTFVAHLACSVVAMLLLDANVLVAAADDPFEVRTLRVVGRPVQVWQSRVSPDCPGGAFDLVVISLAGGPPDETRRLSVIPCQADGVPEAPGARSIEVGPEVVAVDAYDVDGLPGGEFVLLDQRGLQILDPASQAPPRRIDVAGGLPLPPRDRGLSRIPAVDDWYGNGSPIALLPTLSGGLLVNLADATTRPLELPLVANYRTWDPDLPGRVRKLMVSEVHWPVLALGDDDGDGDGRIDLFALTRWHVWVFRNGPDGLPEAPSRRVALQPFGAEDEVRFESTDVTYFAADLNGDGLTDLMLHRISGGVMDGNTVTDIHLNTGAGASAATSPDVTLRVEGGFSGVEPMDLDGDGRSEIVETGMQFGIMQIVRVLLTRKTSVSVRILNWDPASPGQFRTSWEQDMTFKLDFGEGRIAGLLPTAEGDWNADGRKDLLYPKGDDRLAIRLGRAGDGGPGFGKTIAEQPIDLAAGRTRVADVNGDGLDDLIAYDPLDASGRILLLTNRGILPGTRPELKATRAD